MTATPKGKLDLQQLASCVGQETADDIEECLKTLHQKNFPGASDIEDRIIRGVEAWRWAVDRKSTRSTKEIQDDLFNTCQSIIICVKTDTHFH